MKILVDMNLSPTWVDVFHNEGWEARHWSDVGAPTAPDAALLEWARENDYVVFTHDLDFGALLAASHANTPSVFQIRTHDVLPEQIGRRVVDTMIRFQEALTNGALIVLDNTFRRVRILPLE